MLLVHDTYMIQVCALFMSTSITIKSISTYWIVEECAYYLALLSPYETCFN